MAMAVVMMRFVLGPVLAGFRTAGRTGRRHPGAHPERRDDDSDGKALCPTALRRRGGMGLDEF
jgi:hypothetical protein